MERYQEDIQREILARSQQPQATRGNEENTAGFSLLTRDVRKHLQSNPTPLEGTDPPLEKVE